MDWRDTSLHFLTSKLHALNDEIKREDQLMSVLWNHQYLRDYVSDLMKLHRNINESKSIKVAQMWRRSASKQFEAKHYSESIESYTECAMYAPEDSCERSVAIANRSASLFFLNRYKDCMKDMELAIKLNYPKELHYKLHLRKLQCYLKLGNLDLARNMIAKIRESIDDPNYIAPSLKDNIEKEISGMTFDGSCTPDESKNIDDPLDLRSILMFDENPNFPHASSSIDRKFNEELGRHVVANRFIRKGEVLFLEKPIRFVFENDVVGRICQHCCRSTDIPVPCSKCLNTFYCDTNCLNEAWSSYHRWICPGIRMGLWKGNVVEKLALKVLLICETTTDTIKFNEMQNLITNFDKIPKTNLIFVGLMAMFLTKYLLEDTDFFQRDDPNNFFTRKCVDNRFNSNFHAITDDNRHVYVSSLLLRYMLQVNFNGSLICKINNYIRKIHHSIINMNATKDILATAIYLSASMMNHSCDSNIVTNFMDQYQIVRASRDIAANEEILNCYGLHYRCTSTEERQKQLLSQYYFTCKCKPCTQPNLKYFLERCTAMNCSKCNGALCNIKNSLFCLDCFDKPEHFQRDAIERAEKLFNEATSYMVEGNYEVVIRKLEECLYIRRKMLYKYNEDIVCTLRLMSKVYMTEGKFADFKKCGQRIIAVITEKFGPFGVELADTLYELAGACIMHLKDRSDSTTILYKAILITIHEYLKQVEELIDLNCGSWSEAYIVYKHVKNAVNRLDNPSTEKRWIPAMEFQTPLTRILSPVYPNRHLTHLPL